MASCLRAVAPSTPAVVAVDLLPEERLGSMLSFYSGVSAATWFTGDAALAEVHLRARVARIVELNPWLTGRLVLRNGEPRYFVTRPRRVQLLYDPSGAAADCCFGVCDDPSVDEAVPYMDNHAAFTTYIVPSGQETVGVFPSPPLYRVTLVRVSSNAFAVIDSVSHMIADAHTFHKLHGMLSEASEPAALTVERCMSVTSEARALTVAESFCVLNAHPLTVARNVTCGGACSATIQPVCAHWIEREREKASRTGGVRVSTNDLLMSWLCSNAQPDLATMMVNLRGRVPSLTDAHAGNYTSMIPFRPADYASPALFRRAVSATPLRRVFHDRPLPGSFTWSRKGVPRLCSLGCATSWVALYEDIVLPGCESIRHQPVLGGLALTSRGSRGGPFKLPFDNMILFRPRKDCVAVLYLGSHLMTSEMLAELGH